MGTYAQEISLELLHYTNLESHYVSNSRRNAHFQKRKLFIIQQLIQWNKNFCSTVHPNGVLTVDKFDVSNRGSSLMD